MLDMALRAPGRALGSSAAQTVVRDARACQSVLERYQAAEPTPSAGTGTGAGRATGPAVPSASGMAVPSASGMATPDAGAWPYILQCDRATTLTRLVGDADAEPATLVSDYGLPELDVDQTAPADRQIAQAGRVGEILQPLARQLLQEKPTPFPGRTGTSPSPSPPGRSR